MEKEGGLLEIGRPRSRESKNLGPRWTRGVGGLENWAIFMDVICLSSLTENRNIITNLYHHFCDFLTRNNKRCSKKNKTRQGVECHVKKKYTKI